MHRAKNLAEERESKFRTFLDLATLNNLIDIDLKGLPLMMQIRALTTKLVKHTRHIYLTFINREFREWDQIFHLVQPGMCYICKLKR